MLGFILPLLFAALPLVAFPQRGVYTFLPLIVALVVFPLLDLILPQTKFKKTNQKKWFFDGVLYVYAFYHVFLILWVFWFLVNTTHSRMEIIGIILSTGVITGGIGFTFAHELIHRKKRFERFLGELILVFVCYGHFKIAHVWGHHKNVGTPKDPATAKKGQSIYGFYLQVIPGAFLESMRLRKQQTLVYLICSLVIAILFYFFAGILGLWLFLGQSFFAILLLEAINYIEHYGLKRKEISTGKYESVKPEHSWDSSALLSGYLLIHLQRHSDHHLHVLKEYPELELNPSAASMPTGYPGMFVLALIPPLWFWVMDRRLT